MASLPNVPISQFLTDTTEWIHQLLVSGKYQYHRLCSPIVISITQVYELIQNCILYLAITTVVWKSMSVIWSYILKGTLWWLLTCFLEIQIEHSPRGPHLWVKWRSPPSPKMLCMNFWRGIKNIASISAFGRDGGGFLDYEASRS
jgi:hypothetical protein